MKESVINIGIETYTIDETIHSEQYTYDDVEKTRQVISERIINTQEEQIRDELIKLGWTPPKGDTMTREELKENICGMTYDDMFKYIYDIESRVCENCKYWKEDFLVYGICDARVADFTIEEDDRNNITSKYFGCNKFERKLESK